MIIFLTTASHAYTNRAVRGSKVCDIRGMSYFTALHQSTLPFATYIFTDFDRLSFWELELAGYLYQILKSKGIKVINNPSKFINRLSLLESLHLEKRNSFNAWPANKYKEVNKFPVFVRSMSAHRGPISKLIDNLYDLEIEIKGIVDSGRPLNDLMVVEFCAQVNDERLFHKMAMFRIGDIMVPSIGVFDSEWSAKIGKKGIASEQAYQNELVALKELHYSEDIFKVFDAASIEYGRADFSIVNDKTQVYEINTNPHIPSVKKNMGPKDHPYPVRLESMRFSFELMMKAFVLIDSKESRSIIRVQAPALDRQRKKDRWMTTSSWVP